MRKVLCLGIGAIRRLIRQIFWKSPAYLIPCLVQIRFRRKFIYPISLTREDGTLKLVESENNVDKKSQIYFYHPLRVTRYFEGIDARIDKLLQEYCIDSIKDLQSGFFVDIGSNVAEFSIGLAKRFPSSTFIRFEPSPEENLASAKNMQGIKDVLIPKALWKESTTLSFYRRNENGDSSLFSPDNEKNSVLVHTTTLDYEIGNLGIEQIELLKLEAEGAEPEILLGGEETLKKCKYVTADLGPERGKSQEGTFSEAQIILETYGFSLIARNSGARECYLFKNNHFKEKNLSKGITGE